MPLVYDAMKRAMDETGEAKLFSANITADDHYEMLRARRIHPRTFGPDADKVAFLVDGYVGGPGMITTARRSFPTSTCTTTAPATAPSPRPVPSAATTPTCWPR
jgi:ribulose-bisphosphate carboxylase large chain